MRILKIENAKASDYCFYIKYNMFGDFQICISVLLKLSSRVVVESGWCIDFNYLNKAVNGEFSDIYLKSVLRKFLKKNEKRNEMKF